MYRKYKWLFFVLFSGWTVMIFTRSMQNAQVSTEESALVLELLKRLFPVDMTIGQVRKVAHFAEFAVLGVLAQLAFGGFFRTGRAGVAFSVVAGLVIALCDETVQLFVEGRSGEVKDVWLDLLGAITGALFAFAIRALIRKKKSDQ